MLTLNDMSIDGDLPSAALSAKALFGADALLRLLSDELAAQPPPRPDTKQLFLRRALDLAGLGFVGSGLTSQRTVLGEVLKNPTFCLLEFQTNTSACSFPPFPSVSGGPRESAEGDSSPPTVVFPELDVASLRAQGLVKLPNVLSAAAVQAVRADIRSQVSTSKLAPWQKLRSSSGTGSNGAYAYFVPEADSPLYALRNVLGESLGMHVDKVEASRMIVLSYGDGGVNWLHSDQTEWPWQALVMLNERGEDFVGGEFVVQSLEDLRAAPSVAALSSCDVCVFAANEIPPAVAPTGRRSPWDKKCGPDASPAEAAQKRFMHGMRLVGKGTRQACERWAVGLLQPREPQRAATGTTGKKRKAK